MPYRSAFIGCGPRAKRHAEAYAHVRSIRVEAACDLDAKRLEQFTTTYSIPRLYNDYRRMLEEVKPDVVHCVTQPAFRVEPVRVCAEHGVKAVIIEKPMAENLAAAQEIEQIAQRTGIKVIVNTQRRYFASWQGLCQVVESGKAGAIRHIAVRTNPAVSCIGSHFMDLIQRLLGDPNPQTVWATAYGAEDYHTSHPGPSSLLASVVYPGRIALHLEQSKDAVGVPGCAGFWMSSRIDVITERGHLWWTDGNGWGYQFDGMAAAVREPYDFMVDQAAGQGAFTEAIATWLDDPARPHGNRLETAIRVYRIVCTMIQSVVEGRRIAYDPDNLKDCFGELRDILVAREGDHPERVDWSTCADAVRKPAPAVATASR